MKNLTFALAIGLLAFAGLASSPTSIEKINLSLPDKVAPEVATAQPKIAQVNFTSDVPSPDHVYSFQNYTIMGVKAKFVCSQVTNFTGGDKKITLNAVYSTTGENADFAKATPSGMLELHINSDTPAVNYFEPGKSYLIEISEA